MQLPWHCLQHVAASPACHLQLHCCSAAVAALFIASARCMWQVLPLTVCCFRHNCLQQQQHWQRRRRRRLTRHRFAALTFSANQNQIDAPTQTAARSAQTMQDCERQREREREMQRERERGRKRERGGDGAETMSETSALNLISSRIGAEIVVGFGEIRSKERQQQQQQQQERHNNKRRTTTREAQQQERERGTTTISQSVSQSVGRIRRSLFFAYRQQEIRCLC